MTVVTARGAIEAHALVTPPHAVADHRWQTHPAGRVCHFIGDIPGLVKGDIGNDLIAISEEPNVRIMETKGVLCNVSARQARRQCAKSQANSRSQSRKVNIA